MPKICIYSVNSVFFYTYGYDACDQCYSDKMFIRVKHAKQTTHRTLDEFSMNLLALK